MASGSHNAHAPLSPSGSACWTTCTMQPSMVEQKKDEIFVLAILSVYKLRDYLRSLPKEEVQDHEWRAISLAEKYMRLVGSVKDPEKSRVLGEEFITNLSDQDRWDINHSEGSTYSREGTRCHDWAAKVLLNQAAVADVPEEIRDCVEFYTDYCNSQVKPGFVKLVETKVPLSYSDNPEDTGTADFIAASEDLVCIDDLKAGRGELVDADSNTQLAIYGRGVIQHLRSLMLFEFHPATCIMISIVQPRHHGDNPIRTWTTTLADLEEFCRMNIDYPAVQIQTESPARKFAPSDKACKWCPRPVKLNCAARNAFLADFGDDAVSGAEFLAGLPDLTKEEAKEDALKKITLRTGELFDIETRVKWYANTKNIIALLEDNAEDLLDRLLVGNPAPGTKLVMGREGNRDWGDEKSAQSFLARNGLKADDYYKPREIVSPTTAEKLLADSLKDAAFKKRFDGYITRSPAKPVLALASDKRESVCLADGFSDET